MDQRIISLFDEYTHNRIDGPPLKRDEFLKRLANLTGSVASATLLEVNYAQAQTVLPQDERIKTESITFPGADTTNEAAAKLAWERTVAFLKQKLG